MALHIKGNEQVEPLLGNGIDELTAKLWDIEIVSGGQALRMMPQLTIHNALLVLLNGSGTLMRDASIVRMKQETVYVAPAESTFGFEGVIGEECAVAVIHFRLFRESSRSQGKLLAEHAKELVGRWDGVALSPAGRLSGLCRMMKEQHGSEDPLSRWRAQMTLQELLYEIFSAARRRPKADSREALEQAKTYMDEHYGEELTIERLAGIAELSPKYFVDLFKKHYGVSALDHLTHVRMSKAKRLMLSSDIRLKDIAHMVGYEDEFYFSRKFRKSVGLSPTAFIKKRRNRLAVYGSASLLGYLTPLHVVPYAAPLHSKWAGYYYSLIGADIAVHLDAYRHNYHKEANLATLAAAKPSFIICPAGLESEEKAKLLEQAEVYELPGEEAGWRAGLRAVADRLDESDEAERWIEAYDRKALRARESLESEGRAILTVRLIKNQLYVHCNRGMADVLFGSLGATFPIAGAMLPFDRPITLEELSGIEADVVLLLICQETETLEAWKALRQSPEWLSLHAVRDEKVKLIASDPWREYSASAMERMLDDALGFLSGKRP